jgi:hypothetical protein
MTNEPRWKGTAVFRLRRIFNGTMTRGWQVLRDDEPISGLFDKRDDAEAARQALAAAGVTLEEEPKP